MMSDDHYKNLLVYSNKFNTLADNIDYIYNALTQHLQSKMKDERSLKEAYLLCSEVGQLVMTLTSDLKHKATLIAEEIPRVIFQTQH